jgi:hypothetical protein
MKNLHKLVSLAGVALCATGILPQEAHALDQIIRPYQSVRSDAMGGVRITTGLYDENFFNNPARVTANPSFRFTLFDVALEGNSNLPSTISKLVGSGDVIQKLGETAGNNNHVRVQTTFPAVYIPAGEGKWAFAFSLITSTQADVDLRRSFQLSPQAFTDIGPALTVGRRFLENNALSVGATGHAVFRVASNQGYSFIDLIQGRSLSPLQTGGEGSMVDFDLGATYDLPVLLATPFRYHVGASIDNLLGGEYSNLSFRPISSISLLPTAQPRSYNLGVSVTRESWWKFTNTVFALEATDMGNNSNGSLFRLLHLGAETRWSRFAFRGGINQGYFTAGLGIDLRFVTLDLSTYGEEMGLNTGDEEDRRYALRIVFQI